MAKFNYEFLTISDIKRRLLIRPLAGSLAGVY